MAKAPTPAIAIRIPANQLQRIDRRAKKLGISRTQLLIRSALDELDELEQPGRLAEIERRLTALEEAIGR